MSRRERWFVAGNVCWLVAMVMFAVAGQSRGAGIGGVCGLLGFALVIVGGVYQEKACRRGE